MSDVDPFQIDVEVSFDLMRSIFEEQFNNEIEAFDWSPHYNMEEWDDLPIFRGTFRTTEESE